MCNQSFGLIASVIEKSGIPTICLSLLREVAEKVRAPRTLFVPFPIGYPLGAPDQPELQHSIIRAVLGFPAAVGHVRNDRPPSSTTLLRVNDLRDLRRFPDTMNRGVRLGCAAFQRAWSAYRPRLVRVARFFTNCSLARCLALNPVHGAIHPLCLRSCARGKPRLSIW